MKPLLRMLGFLGCVAIVLTAVGCGGKQELGPNDPNYKFNAMKYKPSAGGAPVSSAASSGKSAGASK